MQIQLPLASAGGKRVLYFKSLKVELSGKNLFDCELKKPYFGKLHQIFQYIENLVKLKSSYFCAD